MNSRWLTLVISLPGRSATPRMRIWRALKASGAGILRDGVYVLPQAPNHQELFEQQAAEVRTLQGSAYILRHSSDGNLEDTEQFEALFDRSSDYDAWNERAAALKTRLREMDEPKARREEAQLRRELESTIATDFFAGAAKVDAQNAMNEIGDNLNRFFSPDEPTAHDGVIEAKSRSQYRKRTWATRANLWVDRVASAWLIKRQIDPKAKFMWLNNPKDCPADAVSFDFDGAVFTHVDRFVTFEVLLKSFNLETDVALARMGELVHYLDVGGVSVAEGPGMIALLAGAKSQSKDDDDFAKRVFALLDNFYAAFSETNGKD